MFKVVYSGFQFFKALKSIWLAVFVSSLSIACSTTTVKTTDIVALTPTNQTIAEHLLLDVGVAIFDSGNQQAIEQLEEDELIYGSA